MGCSKSNLLIFFFDVMAVQFRMSLSLICNTCLNSSILHCLSKKLNIIDGVFQIIDLLSLAVCHRFWLSHLVQTLSALVSIVSSTQSTHANYSCQIYNACFTGMNSLIFTLSHSSSLPFEVTNIDLSKYNQIN